MKQQALPGSPVSPVVAPSPPAQVVAARKAATPKKQQSMIAALGRMRQAQSTDRDNSFGGQ